MHTIIMRRPRCCRVEVLNERPEYGHEVEVVIMWMYLNNFDVKMKFIGHVPK